MKSLPAGSGRHVVCKSCRGDQAAAGGARGLKAKRGERAGPGTGTAAGAFPARGQGRAKCSAPCNAEPIEANARQVAHCISTGNCSLRDELGSPECARCVTECAAASCCEKSSNKDSSRWTVTARIFTEGYRVALPCLYGCMLGGGFLIATELQVWDCNTTASRKPPLPSRAKQGISSVRTRIAGGDPSRRSG